MRIFTLANLITLSALLLCSPAWAAETGQDQSWNFVLRVINYGIFLILLIYFARKPVVKGLRSRREKIKEELSQLEASREEAAKAKAEAAALLAKAEEDSMRLLVEYRHQAEAERARILEQAEQQIQHLHEQARLTIARETISAQSQLKNELALSALSTAEKILRHQITPKDQVRLNQEFLANLTDNPSANSLTKAGAK